ncbi:MAG: hypothetical protein ACYC0H_22295 [Solirubrobacteraceae bacterium]
MASRDILVDLNLLIERGWIEGGYEPPNILLAYEPIFETWYFVIDDTYPIYELGDARGNIYIVEENKCFVLDGIYICNDVEIIGNYSTTDRENFITQTLTPLVDEDYTLE